MTDVTQMGPLESFMVGVPVLVVGLAIVFAVLIILWGVLELFRVIFYEAPKKKAEAAKQAKKVEVVKAQPKVEAPAAPVAPAAPAEDEEELVAVLMAAIAASMGTSAGGLRIKSFRRVDNGSVWGRVSRKEQLDNRL